METQIKMMNQRVGVVHQLVVTKAGEDKSCRKFDMRIVTNHIKEAGTVKQTACAGETWIYDLSEEELRCFRGEIDGLLEED